MAPEPGATRSPRKGPGHGAVDRRGEISLVRARVAAATGRVDHERLERLPPRVDACVGNAPRGEHFVLVAGPRPRRGDPRARPRQPFECRPPRVRLPRTVSVPYEPVTSRPPSPPVWSRNVQASEGGLAYAPPVARSRPCHPTGTSCVIRLTTPPKAAEP